MAAITSEVRIRRDLARLLHGDHRFSGSREPGPPPMQAPSPQAPTVQIPSTYDYDMLVIGSGPSGRRAAIQFAKLGKSVLVVEKGRRVGGVSVHTGTIPSKTLRETVLNLSGWRERGFYGRAHRGKKEIQAKDLMVGLHM